MPNVNVTFDSNANSAITVFGALQFLKFCSDVPFSICKIFKPKKSGVTVDYFLLQGAKPDSGCLKIDILAPCCLWIHT